MEKNEPFEFFIEIILWNKSIYSNIRTHNPTYKL